MSQSEHIDTGDHVVTWEGVEHLKSCDQCVIALARMELVARFTNHLIAQLPTVAHAGPERAWRRWLPHRGRR